MIFLFFVQNDTVSGKTILVNGAPPTDEFVRDPATISDAITLANRFTGEELTSIRTTATHHAFFLYDGDHTYRLVMMV
jgi:hypothetical protein